MFGVSAEIQGEDYVLPIIISAIESDTERIFIEKLYCKYYSYILKTATRLTEYDSDEAMELLQETVIRLIEHVDYIMQLNKNKLPSYIGATVRNAYINHSKKIRFERDFYIDPDESLYAPENMPEDLCIKKDLIDKLEQTLEILPEHYRLLLEARYILDLTDEEISTQFKIPKQNVRTYIMRARRKAYSLMKEDLNV